MDDVVFFIVEKFSSVKKLTSSIHSLRDNLHRSTKSDLSNSRTSLNSEQKSAKHSLETSFPKKTDQYNDTSMYPTWSSG